ncbi:MAG: hypothetical protein JXB32_16420, partial [Deltaproteobacteria bacterium]|nr:hypothetical protein [Deltaproteobacteria bacterium]
GDVTSDDAGAEEADAVCAAGSFPYGSTQEVYTAPPGARYMYIKAWGAGGNGEEMSSGCGLVDNGGMGGYTEAVYELLTAPPPFIVIVGGKGHAGAAGTMFFGWGQDGGGGLSGVFVGPEEITPTDHAKALVIAGGGGGVWPGCIAGGCGNHDDAGGRDTMLGGRSTSGDELGVNGGGGGYNGGSGGGRDEAGMGGTWCGGNDRPGMRLVRSRKLAATPGTAVVPNSSDPDYLLAGYPAGMSEQNGWVVIHFTCEEPPLI